MGGDRGLRISAVVSSHLCRGLVQAGPLAPSGPPLHRLLVTDYVRRGYQARNINNLMSKTQHIQGMGTPQVSHILIFFFVSLDSGNGITLCKPSSSD